MPELDTITIQGFKSIASLEMLRLAPINMVIGPNGSGKSNFIGAFEFLREIREGRLQDYVAKAGGANRLLHFGAKITNSIRFHISFKGAVNQYEISVQRTDADELVPTIENAYFWNDNYPQPKREPVERAGKEAGISRSGRTGILSYVHNHLGSWRRYHFHDTSSTSPMRATADLNDNRYLQPDGRNLAAFLYFLKEKHRTSYELIRQTVQQVAPFFEDFNLAPENLNPHRIRLEWQHKHSDAYFDAASFSDGTLRFIALTTLFLQPVQFRPSVILIDEPELGLHPSAITKLASLIKQAARSTQVIAATQSPLLLDHFEPEDVLVADRKNGATEFTRLETEKLSEWLSEFSLGQLWEKNEFGGRPGLE